MGSPFRKKSLERLSSPEQLDQMLQVTSPTTWMAFLSIAALLVVAIIWSLFGSIPQRTNGIGILMPAGDYREFSLQEIPAPDAGLITDLSIAEGDQIQANQLIAQLQPVDYDEQQNAIAQLQLQLSSLQSEDQALADLETQALAQTADQRDREKGGLQAIIDAKTTNLGHLRTIADDKENLARDSAITVAESVQAASDVAAAEAELNEFQHQLIQQDLNYEQLQLDTNKLQTQRKLQQERLQSQVSNLQKNLQDQSEIRAPLSGTVLQVQAAAGNEVRENEIVALLEQATNTSLRVQGYVPIFTGKKIVSGMQVQISPSTIKKEEYGFLKGSVTWISDYPQGPQAILDLVDDQELVDRIISQTEIPLQVEVTLDPGSGGQQYSWSTGNEPPQKLSVGTLTNFAVTTESKRPIELVIPYIRQTLGLD